MTLPYNIVFKTLLMMRKNSHLLVFRRGCGILPLSSALFGRFTARPCLRAFNFCSQNCNIVDPKTVREQHLSLENLTPDLTQLVDNDVVVKEKVHVIFSEYDFYRVKYIKNVLVPSELKSNDIMELLKLDTRSSRLKYLTFLFKKEKLKLSKIAKRERKIREKKERLDTEIEVEESNHIEYGIGKNSIFLCFREKCITKFLNKRLANTSLFGPKIVIDLDYDDYMTIKEKRSCALQLTLLFGINRINPYPFDLYFCNANFSSDCVKYLIASMPNCLNSESVVDLIEKSYLDIFPKERLVYLSPHADKTLEQFDYNDIYIIGGYVDLSKSDHLSTEKAEREGIRSYSLPIDKYIWWGHGSRSLSINQVFEIMLKLKNTGDWKQALEVVPRRKVRKVDPSELEDTDLLPKKMYLVDTSKEKVTG